MFRLLALFFLSSTLLLAKTPQADFFPFRPEDAKQRAEIARLNAEQLLNLLHLPNTFWQRYISGKETSKKQQTGLIWLREMAVRALQTY